VLCSEWRKRTNILNKDAWQCPAWWPPVVGQNSGPIFRRLWTKVHPIIFACAGVSVVCDAVFRLTMSCCVPEIFAIKLRSCPKSRRSFDVFGLPNFGGGRGHPNFWLNFINLGHRRTCGKIWWRSAKRSRRLGGEKKKDLNYSGKTVWGAASMWRAVIINDFTGQTVGTRVCPFVHDS